jgi:allophanate hydrolase
VTEDVSHDDQLDLTFESITQGVREAQFSHADLLREVHRRARDRRAEGVWIHLAAEDALLKRLSELEKLKAQGVDLPLFGLPFAVKDNIDVEGMPTTAACPAFSYLPKQSAFVVERITRAGAIVLGKTNLDQFATGLVGVRSPYGVPRNPFDERYIPGGSSSGSAVAVATGMVAFALGTDTAGSGRVPAAFNNIVGLKPTRGLLSTSGVVPACRSLDCVTIFALTCADAWRVFQVARGFDATDPYARAATEFHQTASMPRSFRFGVPAPADLEFFGDTLAQARFNSAVAVLRSLGGEVVEISLAPFREAARLLYDGPWLSQRLEAAGGLLSLDPGALDPVVRSILLDAHRFSAPDVFRAEARLALLARQTKAVFEQIAALVVPTTPTIYTVEQVRADPIRLNRNLGTYTNFVNLLDLSALAVPSGFRADQLPFGITLIGPAGSEARLAALGAHHHAATRRTLGASSRPWQSGRLDSFTEEVSDSVCLAVVGAHLTGEPLNHQLVDLGATLLRATRTAPHYRLFALANTSPAKPGLLRAPSHDGAAIDVEVWRLSPAAFGAFVAKVPAPLCIGTIELESGPAVPGFLCESYALASARDITSFGGWRAYRAFIANSKNSS